MWDNNGGAPKVITAKQATKELGFTKVTVFKSFYYIDCTRVEARLQEMATYLPGEDERATPLGTKRLWRRIGAGGNKLYLDLDRRRQVVPGSNSSPSVVSCGFAVSFDVVSAIAEGRVRVMHQPCTDYTQTA